MIEDVSYLKFNFSKNFPDKNLSAVGSVHFDETQWVTAIMGPSGVGKTSLGRWIAGHIVADEGFLSFNDETWSDAARKISVSPQERRVGFMAQGELLFPHLTVAENIGYGLRRMKESERKVSVRALLKMIHLEEQADRLPRSLSGGEKRRVALAQVLAVRPRLLVLDEPFNGLDDVTKAKLLNDLKHWIQNFSVPTLLITHDVNEALYFTTKLCCFEEGALRL